MSEAMVHDLRVLPRGFDGRRRRRPSAAVLDGRTLRSAPEGGSRAGYDGARCRRGSKLHIAVDALGHLLAARVAPADEQGRAQVEHLAAAVQEATGEGVTAARVDRDHAGEGPAGDAAAHAIRLEAVEHAGAERGFALPPRRWVVEGSLAWARASAGWRGTTSGCRPPSPACVPWPSFARRCKRSSSCSPEMPDTL